MKTIRDPCADETVDPALLVLLPGAYMKAQDFVTHDFFGAVRRRFCPVDIVAVETGMDTYLDNDIVEHIHDEIIAPAVAAGTRTIWLAGISLGALGALLSARRHAGAIAGLLLLSPFIGSRGLVAQVERAGGLRRWEPAADEAPTIEQDLLRWLQSYDPARPDCPPIHLAYGRDDRYAAAHRLIADLLPSGRVIVGEGGHDWPTWEALWGRMLDAKPFDAAHREGEGR
jgi:pimeloyl-ACP methyl ester carboxylesterase